ncbi:hypothetical protein AWB80_03608 [Caballeronia pedi]|uniref:Uncharacterized protein n=1 Tax=Caballeronia pedi TaxID=1777141 RepID=A0A158BI91_9BURK|nr:hypothetical protein [Caballeronia pedi]SAK69784.1 hypothetical protein AWB80_03608 [Caballeronia pedi]
MIAFSTLFGSFVGAGLAFLSNRYFDHVEQKRANLAAGNMAISILSKQYGDFVIFRAHLQAEATTKNKYPDWLQISPSFLSFSEWLVIDMKSLTFILNQGKRELFARLLDVQARYEDLRRLMEINNEACVARDDAIMQAGLAEADPITEQYRFEAAVNATLKAKLTSANAALRHRAKNEFFNYQTTGQELRGLMISLYRVTEVMTFTAMGAKKELVNEPWRLDHDES